MKYKTKQCPRPHQSKLFPLLAFHLGKGERYTARKLHGLKTLVHTSWAVSLATLVLDMLKT